MDSLKKLEEISLKNEKIFEKVFYKDLNEGYLTNAKPYGYYLNGNYVYRMGGDGTESPFVENTWNKPEFAWLLNSNFKADYISFLNKQILFRGQWHDGVFEGYEFLDGSFFYDGEFRGQIYGATNNSFQATPDKYYSGVWVNHQNGILGIEQIKDPIENTMDSVEIVSVPTGWFVTLVDVYGRKLTFNVAKKIDEKSTDFIFQIYPSLEKIKIPWEMIRSNYLNNGIIIKGRPFYLLQNNYIAEVFSITITNELPEQRISAKNRIDFSVDPKLTGFLSYNNIAFPIEVNSSTQEGKDFVEQFKKDLTRGVFSDVLDSIRSYIAAGTINGFSDDDFIGLAPLFNNIKGSPIRNKKVFDLMSYLNNFMLYIVKESENVDTSSLITESIIRVSDIILGKLKKKLRIDKYIKKFPVNKKEISSGLGNGLAFGRDSRTELQNQQDFIQGKSFDANAEEEKRNAQMKGIQKVLKKPKM